MSLIVEVVALHQISTVGRDGCGSEATYGVHVKRMGKIKGHMVCFAVTERLRTWCCVRVVDHGWCGHGKKADERKTTSERCTATRGCEQGPKAGNACAFNRVCMAM